MLPYNNVKNIHLISSTHNNQNASEGVSSLNNESHNFILFILSLTLLSLKKLRRIILTGTI